MVTTVQSLRAQGEGSLGAGFPNLVHHIQTLRQYGAPIVVAINRFPNDSPAELEAIGAECAQEGIPCSVVEAFAKGGIGAADLAEKVVGLIDANPSPDSKPVYSLEDTFEEKIRKVATGVYGAADVALSETARAKLLRYAEWGLWPSACLHRQDTVFSDRQAQAHGRARRLDAERHRCFALRRRGLCGSR